MSTKAPKTVFTVANAIEQALADLNEEDRKFALRIVCEYHSVELASVTLPKPPDLPSDTEDLDQKLGEEGVGHGEVDQGKSLETYLAPLAEKPATEFAAHFAFFRKFKAEKKQDFITPKGYSDACRAAGRAVPGNPSQTLTNAKASEYLEDAGRGKYKLTVKGENLARGTLRRTRSTANQDSSKPAGAKPAAGKKKSSKKS